MYEHIRLLKDLIDVRNLNNAIKVINREKKKLYRRKYSQNKQQYQKKKISETVDYFCFSLSSELDRWSKIFCTTTKRKGLI